MNSIYDTETRRLRDVPAELFRKAAAEKAVRGGMTIRTKREIRAHIPLGVPMGELVRFPSVR